MPVALGARVLLSVGDVGPASPNALRARPSTAGLILDTGDELDADADADADTMPFPSRGRACVALLSGVRLQTAQDNIRKQLIGHKSPHESCRICHGKR